LDIAVRMFAQYFFTKEIFSFRVAMDLEWWRQG
jgi:hypothetical protein